MSMNDFNKFNKLFETQNKFRNILELSNKFKPLSNSFSSVFAFQTEYSKMMKAFTGHSHIFKQMDNLSKFALPHFNSSFDILKKFSIGFNSNPEVQYITIAELELLSATASSELAKAFENDSPDEFIVAKEEILEEHLLPYLERLNVDKLWLGANYALSAKDNPDNLRHALVSLRTLLEFLIDEELAPLEELSKAEAFKKEFEKALVGGKPRIKRQKKIKYFTSKIEFGLLSDFNEKDINLICNCYDTLCNLHKPNVNLSENQVRILKVKTGILVWLMAYINEIVKEGQPK